MRSTSGSGWTREKLRITAAVALPGFILLLASGVIGLDHWRVEREMRQVEAFARLASQVGTVVHEFQIERGLSVVYLAGESEVLGARLSSQCERCNGAIGELRTSLVDFDFDSYPDGISFHVKDVISQTTRLDEVRRSVHRRELSPEATLEKYSGAIAALLRLLREMSVIATTPRVPRLLNAYLDLLEAKERAGQERALGGISFAAGGMTEANQRRLASLIDAQATYLDRFRSGASSEQRALLQKQLESDATKRVNELRRSALASVGNGDTREIDTAVWFDAATRRIVELKILEDRVNANVSELASGLASGAFKHRATVYLSLTALAAVIVGILLREFRERKQIKTLAYYDGLTELPNRELFRDKLEEALGSARREKRRMAVLFLDLDQFKRVNDTLGHRQGDRLLVKVAKRLLMRVRNGDCVARGSLGDSSLVLSRLGGDEFTILLTNLSDPQNAALVAQRVLDVLRAPFVVDGNEVFATASIGIAVYPSDGEDGEILLRNADAAMYCAKENGRDGYRFFSDSMYAVSKRKLELASGLRRALDRDEFSLCYQPLRDAVSGKLIGAEALLRWETSERDSVGPAEFIPVAEETGLIAAIGEWVLRTACVQAQAWLDAGFQPIRMAVNLSGQQLRDTSFVETVADVLQESGLSPAYLEFEITESSIIQSGDVIEVILRDLHERGIALVLDDFGTGYSSLSHLRRFPISRVKIDRSFVSRLPADPDDAALTAAIIAMAHSLRLTVVGEGVETLEQAEFLRELGCDIFQGYLFSPAVPAEEFVRFLEQEKRE